MKQDVGTGIEADHHADGCTIPGFSRGDLSPDDRKKVFEYNFIVRLLPEMPDEELRAIFQRINRNTVTLNLQELRHATYWGPFIKLMEEVVGRYASEKL